jgi:hypothetical protein
MKEIIAIIVAVALAQFGVGRAQDHGHLNVGATAQAQDAKLRFDNGADFGGDYVNTLTYTNGGKYANLYQGNITLTALHSVNAFGEPVLGATAPGSFIIAEIVSVHGPAGGEFQFWETNSTTEAAFHIPVATTNGAFRYELSEASLGAGQPGGDPYGHIHGRRFAVTKPGLYSIGFRTLDISTNGTGGGPIHTPSDVLHVYFQGDVNITHVEPDVDHVHVTFGAQLGYTWQLQSKETFADASWTMIGAPVAGNDKLIEIEDDREVGFSRFYRLAGTVFTP